MSTSPSRRGLLGAFAALPLAAIPAVHAVAATDNPDAELIATCKLHIESYHAVNASENDDDSEDPVWVACCETQAAIDAAQPRTLAGVVAKARAALEVARDSDGTYEFEHYVGGDWARDCLLDLIRLSGEPDTGGEAAA